jgi:hypothetical protein
MTHDEGLIMDVLRLASIDLAAAEDALAELTRNRRLHESLSAAAVFSRATAELALARRQR